MAVARLRATRALGRGAAGGTLVGIPAALLGRIRRVGGAVAAVTFAAAAGLEARLLGVRGVEVLGGAAGRRFLVLGHHGFSGFFSVCMAEPATDRRVLAEPSAGGINRAHREGRSHTVVIRCSTAAHRVRVHLRNRPLRLTNPSAQGARCPEPTDRAYRMPAGNALCAAAPPPREASGAPARPRMEPNGASG